MGVNRRFLSCLVALGLSGCAGYRLGPSNGTAAGEKSIQINPFPNQTTEPHLTDAVTAGLRQAIQRDGTYRLASNGDADIVVSGVITRYERYELSFVDNNTLTVQDFRESLTATVTARERSTGKVLFTKPVTGSTLVRIGNDMPSAERQALPSLAGDWAKNATALLVEGTW